MKPAARLLEGDAPRRARPTHHGLAALCTAVAVVTAALVVMVFRSGWAPWVVGATAVVLITLALALAGAVIAVAVALSRRDGREWLADQAARLAQARAVREQHLHLPGGTHTFHE